jgi:endonuclease/exonuclease/phosphatase family metal-dependent hydrolase
MANKIKRLLRLVTELYFPIKTEFWDFKCSNELSIMTFNMLGDKEEEGEKSWVYRRGPIINMIKDKMPDIIGCQEIWSNMVKYLCSKIGHNYDCYGVSTFNGRRLDKTFSMTMGNAIFYNKERFECIEEDVFWLADIENKPNSTWGNSEPRNCVVVKLKDRNTGKIYVIYNTHFDHKSQLARFQSTELIMNKAQEHKNSIIYILGDFNAKISNDEMIGFNQFSYYPNPLDTQTTFNGFRTYKNQVIDYIFTNDDDKYKLEVIKNGYGIEYLSDHYPVMIYKN